VRVITRNMECVFHITKFTEPRGGEDSEKLERVREKKTYQGEEKRRLIKLLEGSTLRDQLESKFQVMGAKPMYSFLVLWSVAWFLLSTPMCVLVPFLFSSPYTI